MYVLVIIPYYTFLFFFNDTATTEIYTLSLHDALPIYARLERYCPQRMADVTQEERTGHRLPDPDTAREWLEAMALIDRKSTRLNSSHANISYAVFCLKKKKKNKLQHPQYS